MRYQCINFDLNAEIVKPSKFQPAENAYFGLSVGEWERIKMSYWRYYDYSQQVSKNPFLIQE